jgi:hypothetical protein
VGGPTGVQAMKAPRPWRHSPGEALVAVCALLRHPPVRAEPGMPKGKWLNELAGLVGKACLRPGAQGSRTITGGPSYVDSRPLSQQPTLGRSGTGGSRDLSSRLDEKRAGEDTRTTLEHTREWRRDVEEDHTSSSSPAQGNQRRRSSVESTDPPSFGQISRRSMMVPSTLRSSSRSTPQASRLPVGGLRSRPTTSTWP